MSSAYLRWLICLLAILIPACDSSSPAFLMMYSACKLNKQGENIQPWWTPFPIWNQSVVPCQVLTVASWPACRFLKRQVRGSGVPISLRIFHSLLWSALILFSLIVLFSYWIVSDSAAPWTVARQTSLSMGFPKQVCWSGVPFPSPGDLSNPGIKPGSPAL